MIQKRKDAPASVEPPGSSQMILRTNRWLPFGERYANENWTHFKEILRRACVTVRAFSQLSGELWESGGLTDGKARKTEP
jgi:hypothetical protein